MPRLPPKNEEDKTKNGYKVDSEAQERAGWTEKNEKQNEKVKENKT